MFTLCINNIIILEVTLNLYYLHVTQSIYICSIHSRTLPPSYGIIFLTPLDNLKLFDPLTTTKNNRLIDN